MKFAAKCDVSALLTAGEVEVASWNTADRNPREITTPHKLIISSFFLPVLSMKYMLTIEPKAFSPAVTSDRRRAV